MYYNDVIGIGCVLIYICLFCVLRSINFEHQIAPPAIKSPVFRSFTDRFNVSVKCTWNAKNVREPLLTPSTLTKTQTTTT